MELFKEMIGIVLLFGGVFAFWVYTKDAMDTYKQMKREEHVDAVKKHPILASIVSGLVAWKAFDIWNKSRTANQGTDAGDSNGEGRSVYEDLNLE